MILGVLLLALGLPAQEAARPLSPQQRLLAAHTIYIEHLGSTLPYDVIIEAFRGWGRYEIVREREQAELIVSIQAPTIESGMAVNGRSTGGQTVIRIALAVLDAHDRLTLWAGSEQPKGARKASEREDHVVDSSLALFRRFRQTIEPEPAP